MFLISPPLASILTSFMSYKASTKTFSYALTCFGVCRNKYIIWPGLKVLDLLPVFGELLDHCDSMEIKEFPSTKLHL